MNTAKTRLATLSNKTVKGAVRRICESLIEMADSIPDHNLSEIAIDKLSAYSSDVAVKSFISNESRLMTLTDMGIKKSAERIINESSIGKYPHLKGPISQFKKLSESNPDYLIIENYLNSLKSILWEPIVKSEFERLEKIKSDLNEDILVKTSVDIIKTSRNSFIYGPLIEKLDAYIMDRTTASRKIMIQELDRYKFDTNINKLANSLRLIENSFGGFNVLANTSKCTVKPSIGFVDIKESADYILLDGSFYKKSGSKIIAISENEVQKNSPSLHALNNISRAKNLSIQGDNVVMFMGRDTVKLHESGTIELNGNALTREELKHKAAVTSIIDPAYSRSLTDVLTVHENISKLMELDFSKTITSNIYEGVKMNVIKGNEYVVNYVNPSMNENKTLRIESATKLKNFVWDTLAFDISESFVETLSEENREINKLQRATTGMFNRIVLLEKELSKIELEKANDEDVRENKTIMQLEEALRHELRVLKSKYALISNKLNEATMGVSLPSVGDTVKVRSKGTGTVLSVDGVDRKFIVLLNSGETCHCIDKDIDVIEPMIKTSSGASPEVNLQMIQGSNAKPSGKHSDVKKMMKESSGFEDVYSQEDPMSVSIDDVKGMSTDPSNVVRHSEFGGIYDEDMTKFTDMASKGQEDINPALEESLDGMREAEHNYDFEDWEEMDAETDDYMVDDTEDEDWDYGTDADDEEEIEIAVSGDMDDFDYDSGYEEDDLDDYEEEIPKTYQLDRMNTDRFSTDMVDDDRFSTDTLEYDEEDYDEDDYMEEDEYDEDEELDEENWGGSVQADELDMEHETEEDLHHYDHESKIHPGYGSKQHYMVDTDDEDYDYEINEYPDEENDLQIQFEDDNEDEELMGSYGGSIHED